MNLTTEKHTRTVADELLSRGFSIRTMNAEDIPEVQRLLAVTEGLSVQEWETDDCLIRAIRRNGGLAQVAVEWNEEQGRSQIVGSVFVGEGLMGMVNHLAIMPRVRGEGLATHLVRAGLKRLYHTSRGARRVYITALKSNATAQAFWQEFGAQLQATGDLWLFTMDLNPHEYPWLEQ